MSGSVVPTTAAVEAGRGRAVSGRAVGSATRQQVQWLPRAVSARRRDPAHGDDGTPMTAMTETRAYRTAKRRYLAEFLAAMAAYTLAVFASSFWLRAHPGSGWRVPVALAPVVPIVAALWAWVRLFRCMDELYRRIQVEALALAFGGTALLVIAYGFLEVAGFPRLTVWWVWVVMATLWFVGLVVARLRYR